MESVGNAASTVQVSGAAECPAGSPLLLFLAALLSSISSKREAERLERAQQESGPSSGYDYVVVGGGSSGSVLAARLAEDKFISVLLLERGSHEPEEARVPAYTINNLQSAMAELFNAEPEPQNCNGTGCLLNVPTVLGGGSALNGMLYVRGSSVDYDEWARITGDDGWGFNSVLRYFKKAEDNLNPPISGDTRFHGRGGPQPVSWMRYRHPVTRLFAQAFAETGSTPRLDINAESQLGHSIIQTTTAGGERWTTFRSYVEHLPRRNLRVETFATARKVVLEEGLLGSLKAVGVEYVDAAGKTRVVRAKREVVLTAGALHTPQILMLSGIGPADQLKASGIPVKRDLPVGETLFDHPDVAGLPYKCEPPLCTTDWQSRLQDLQEYKDNRTGPLSAFNILHFNVYARSPFATPGTGQQPDLQLLFLGNTVDEYVTCLPFDSWRLNRVVPLISVMRPCSQGSVRLNASDVHGRPIVKLNYFGDAEGHDLAVAVEGLKIALRLEAPLARLNLTLDKDANPQCASEGDFGSDAYLRCVARTRTATSWHWSGTCRMGRAGDPRAVLDSRLRVRGVRRLRVADASAMPFIPSGNTNAPTIMLAERAADIIKQDRSRCPLCV